MKIHSSKLEMINSVVTNNIARGKVTFIDSEFSSIVLRSSSIQFDKIPARSHTFVFQRSDLTMKHINIRQTTSKASRDQVMDWKSFGRKRLDIRYVSLACDKHFNPRINTQTNKQSL